MADMEHKLAESLEEDLNVKALAEKFAPRPDPARPPQLDALDHTPRKPAIPSIMSTGGTIESKLVAIEKLIGEVRQLTAQIRSVL